MTLFNDMVTSYPKRRLKHNKAATMDGEPSKKRAEDIIHSDLDIARMFLTEITDDVTGLIERKAEDDKRRMHQLNEQYSLFYNEMKFHISRMEALKQQNDARNIDGNPSDTTGSTSNLIHGGDNTHLPVEMTGAKQHRQIRMGRFEIVLLETNTAHMTLVYVFNKSLVVIYMCSLSSAYTLLHRSFIQLMKSMILVYLLSSKYKYSSIVRSNKY